MADLGADVWKIEPMWGDETRAWGPPFDPASGQSSYFRSANRGKVSLAVDLKQPQGADLVRALARKADVLVENYKVGDLARYGLSYTDLLDLHPSLIYVSITGFGQTGPRAAEAGYDAALQGEVGIMSVTGEVDGPPQKVGVAWVDLLTAYATLSATLAALRERDRSGLGQHVDMALFDVGLTAMANLAQATLDTGLEPKRWGNDHAQIVPYGSFPAADGWFMLAVGNDMQFAKLCKVIEKPEWSAGGWAMNEYRVRDRVALVAALEAELRHQPKSVWLSKLKAEGVPCGPVNSLPEALNDPQALARGLVREGRLGHPFGSLANAVSGSPNLGQGGAELLQRELGLTAEELVRLRAEGVILAGA